MNPMKNNAQVNAELISHRNEMRDKTSIFSLDGVLSIIAIVAAALAVYLVLLVIVGNMLSVLRASSLLSLLSFGG